MPSDSDTILGHVDDGIRYAVRVLLAKGIETHQSCQGGAGHAYPYPTVDFGGDNGAGYRAFGIALSYGLPVRDLSRVWYNNYGELDGPLWRLTFRKPVPDPTEINETLAWSLAQP